MKNIETLQGFWKVAAYEQAGVPRSTVECRQRASLVLCSEIVVAGSDGIWGEIKYLQPPTVDAYRKSLRSLRQLINGQDYERSPNYYLYSGGILYLGTTPEGFSSVDFVVYHGSYLYSIEPEHSIGRGIYRLEGDRLTICLADAGTKARPGVFGSTESPYQSLSVYVREESSELTPTH